VQSETGGIYIGTAVTNADSVCGVGGVCGGDIQIGTLGQRVITTGNVETNSALRFFAGSGNMATTVAGGTYSLDATGNIALESSGGEILIGDDSINQAIKMGTQGSRTVTVGNAAATVSVKAHTIDATFAAGEFAVQDADLYEMVEVAGRDADTSAIVSLRADTFLLFDGTTSTAEMPSASDSSLVMKVTAAGGTVLTDSAVSITAGTSLVLQAGEGNMAFTVTGGTHTVDADNGINMESSGGQIAIGADNVNQPVTIASAGQRAISVGNSNANTAVNLHAGTGNMALTVTSGSFSLEAGTGVAIESQTGSIVIGGDAGACSNPASASTSAACTSGWAAATGSIKMGTAGERTLTLGNTESSSALQLYAGSGGLTITVASGAYSLDTTGAIALESSAGEIQIGTDAVGQAVKIGTAGARAVTIGSSASSTSSSLNLHAGTGNMVTTVTGGTYSLDTTGSIALESSGGEILIGDDSVNQAIKVGTKGGRVITLGNVESSAAVNINAGSGNMVTSVVGGTYTVDASGGVEFETHTSGMITLGHRAGVCTDPVTATSQAGCTGVGAVWTPTSGAVNIGTGGQRSVTIGNAESSTALSLHAGSGNMDVAVTGGMYTLGASSGIGMETKTSGDITIGTNAGVCTSPSTAVDTGSCTGSWTPTTGAIKVGTGGQRTLTIGNLEASTVDVKGGSGVSITSAGDINLAATGGASSNVLVSQGNLGINQGTPTYALHIGSTGDDSGAVANSWNTFSDARLKTNITSIGAGVLEGLLRLRPVTFDWRNTSRHDLGFIAQELRQTFPLLVHQTSDGLLSVDYPRLNVYIARALQEEVAARRKSELSFRREVDELRDELASLRMLLSKS
jgi:hypothetical protein